MAITSSLSTFLGLLGSLAGGVPSVCFPADCQTCNRLLTHASRLPLCDDCLSSFQVLPPGCCELCGEPGAFDPEFPKETNYCPDCQAHRFAFQLARRLVFTKEHWRRQFCILNANRSNR